MTFRDVSRLLDYWGQHPPEHEILALLARCYTDWNPEPESDQPATASIEERWRQGAMNPADLLALYQRTGGVVEGIRPIH